MKPQSRPVPIKSIALIILAVAAIILGFFVYTSLQFHITGATPNNKRFPSSLSTIDIYFSKELDQPTMTQRLDANTGDVLSYTFESKTTTKVTGNKLSITFHQTPLTGNYVISLKNITAENGDVLTTDLPFIVKTVSYKNLTEAEKKQYDDAAGFSSDDEEEHSDPIAAVLPHETADYLISYSIPGDDSSVKKIIITMKFFAPGNNAKPATPQQTAAYLDQIRTQRKAALAYLASKNINISDYAMEYTELELRNEFPAGKSF